MAKRELKNFIDALQCLNYPRPVGLDSFRTPNFELVADILCYSVQLVDSTIPIHDGIGTAADRVQFLNGITVELASRLNLSLDGRKLYSADGYAVQELLKLAQFIQRALALADEASSSNGSVLSSTASQSAQQARSIAKEITEMGAKIQDLLKHEAADSDERTKTIKLSVDKQRIEESIKQILNETNDAVERLDKQCKMLISTEKGLEEKIRKRSIDLERNTKRLETLTLQNVRPAFMDEYEQLEKELQVEYDRYVVRFRNVDYLERELRSRRASANKKLDEAERSVKRRQKKFREEELRILEGSDGSDNDEATRERSIKSRGKENSRPKDNTAATTSEYAKARPSREEDSMLSISVQDLSRIDVSSSTNSTPRDHEGSSSEPSGVSFEDTVMGSDMTGSISFNSDDDF